MKVFRYYRSFGVLKFDNFVIENWDSISLNSIKSSYTVLLDGIKGPKKQEIIVEMPYLNVALQSG
jgi:hypothetical protein